MSKPSEHDKYVVNDDNCLAVVKIQHHLIHANEHATCTPDIKLISFIPMEFEMIKPHFSVDLPFHPSYLALNLQPQTSKTNSQFYIRSFFASDSTTKIMAINKHV